MSYIRKKHGRLARWRKLRACDVGEAKEGLENELWRTWSTGRVGEWAVLYVKRRKGWRMSCDVGEVKERLDNELCSFSNLLTKIYTQWAELILQPFLHFTYVTAHSPTLPSLYLRHSSFSNPSVALPTPQLILQPFFRFSFVTGSSLTSPGEPPMVLTYVRHRIRQDLFLIKPKVLLISRIWLGDLIL